MSSPTNPPDDGAVFDLMVPGETCEGCNDPATCRDSMDVPLCEACYGALPFDDTTNPIRE